MNSFPIPIVALGAGSQPVDERLDCLPMPQNMSVFARPGMDDIADPEVREAVASLLDGLLAAMRERRDGVLPSIDLTRVDPRVVRALNDALGQGEVSVLANRPAALRIQETAFAGIWRILRAHDDGSPDTDAIEVCPMPSAVAASARAALPVAELPAAPDVMNAPALVKEIRAAAASRMTGTPAHVVNLTLLPVSPADLDHLVAALGPGTTAILSRGYGNCRISSTATPDVWWVQYYNSTEQLILNTVEVIDVPEVALAAAEDIDDSIVRLDEYVRELRSV